MFLESGMSFERITVLVSAIGGGGHGEQILKALRMADTDYRIIGADNSPLCPQFEMVDVALTLPKADSPDYIDAVLAVCKKYDVAAVFHGCEPELKALSEARHRFEEAGILLPINPPDVITVCMDKSKTREFLRERGFSTPKTLILDSSEQLDQIDFYPVVIKPIRGGGSFDVFIAQNPRELEILQEYLSASSKHFIVQEYVGSYENEFTVGVLHDLNGNFVNSIAMRRRISGALNMRSVVRNVSDKKELGEWLVISSGVSHGDMGAFPEVTGPCERIAAELGVRGAINVQCRFVDGEVRVFEINPRFSGTTSIRAMMGYNEPDLLLRHHLLGEPYEVRFPYRSGTVIRSLKETLLSDEKIPSWKDVL